MLYEDDNFREFKEALELETQHFEQDFKKELDKNVKLFLVPKLKIFSLKFYRVKRVA